MPDGRTTTSTGVLVRATDEAVDALFDEFTTMVSEFEEMQRLQKRMLTVASLTDGTGARYLELANAAENRKDSWKRNNLMRAMADACKGRRFFITSRYKYMGVAPDITEPGDKICVIPGCCAPFAIRPKGDQYQLIGECYVEGLMNGEAMKNGNVSVETIAFE